MISSLTGELKSVGDGRARIRAGAMVFELLVPAIDVAELEANLGTEQTFHTIFYLQGDSSGGSMEPRLIGFLREPDKRFFEKFVTVKGIGPKTALKAFTVPVGEIAQAIESKDARFLVKLDGVGKRTAELIVAELGGKVKEFASPLAIDPDRPSPPRYARRTADEEDAISTLMALGERRTDAEHLLDRAKSTNTALAGTDQFVREMLRLRGSR